MSVPTLSLVPNSGRTGRAGPVGGVTRLRALDGLRGGAAGLIAVATRLPARALFEAGGRKVLPAAVQTAVRLTVEGEAALILTGAGLLGASACPVAAIPGRGVAAGAARALAGQTAQVAGRKLAQTIAFAAGAGLVIDGGWALFEAIRGMREGSMTERQAIAHVAREAATGGLATAAGTAAAAILGALTGGVATPALFLVGAATSVGAKAGLNAWLSVRRRDPLRVEMACVAE